MTTETAWFVDSSVLLAAILGTSAGATSWFEAAQARGDTFVGSRLLEVEVERFILNKELVGELPRGCVQAARYLDKFELFRVDDDLLSEAMAIQQPLRGADAIHVATALRIGRDEITIVTHDAQMARACGALGFQVIDPITA